MLFKSLFFAIFCAMFLVGCINTAPSTGRKGSSETESVIEKPTGSNPAAGSNANNAIPEGTEFVDSDLGIPELRHLVDPIEGTYKTKLTIPKNLSGHLYVSGLNIPSLRDKFVKVRFKFGRSLEPITIDATVSRAPGIIPQTDIEVLILDLSNRPFENIRLLYDLYDYNTYATTSIEPIVDPRNGGLFCRGLDLQYDPTFNGNLIDGCKSSSSVCKYAYAKLLDSGLYSSGIAMVPKEPQIDLAKTTSGNYGDDTSTVALKKCLPDNNSALNLQQILANTTSVGAASTNFGGTVVVAGTNYIYKGPFRTANTTDWQIKESAVRGPFGLFAQQISTNTAPYVAGLYDGGYSSYLFPRAGTMELSAGIDYFGSATNLYIAGSGAVTRSETMMSSAGNSTFVDGCNLRVTNYDSFTNEGIQSCNVTSTIEIISVDPTTGEESVHAESSKLKLQLIRPSTKDNFGNEILSTSMKSCSSSSSCGSDECCFNERCWSKDLVSRCVEDVSSSDNRLIGESCSSDFQCSSFCCGATTSKCAVHDNTLETPVLCSKPPGQSCIAKEWCRKETVAECKVVKTGTDQQGNTTCALRCYNKQVHGTCTNGSCVMPKVPAVPPFDPLNPNCDGAVDPE